MKQRIFSGLKPFYFLALYISDALMFLVSAWLTCKILDASIMDALYIRFYIFALLILMVNHSAYNLYKDKRNLFDDNDLMQIVYSVLVTLTMLIAFALIFDPANTTLILMALLVPAFSAALTIAARYMLGRIILSFRKAGYDKKKVLFFGEHNDELIEKIKENSSLGYEVIKTTNDVNTLKKYLDLVQIVFLHMEHIDDKLLEIIIKNDKIQWKIAPPVLNLVIDPVRFDEFKDYPIITVSGSGKTTGYLYVKRAMDIVLSSIALVVLSPLFLFVAIIIKLTMPGPVFFKQERLGKNLKPFLLYKFRSMIADADKLKEKLQAKNEVKGLFKMKDDPRITKFGKFLRRTNIDELPQLINIFLGDMSFVGPRPHLQIELCNFKSWRMARFNVKPGLTGLWQVNGRHELNFDKAVLYDIYYIKHMSFVTDISIILKTVPAILMSRGRH